MYFSRSLPPSLFLAFLGSMKPSIGASTESVPLASSMIGNGVIPMSAWSACGVCRATCGVRDATVRLDLLGQRDVVVPVLRGLVALLLERALPVEQRPRVVVDRHEVLLAVRAGRGGLERVGEAVQAAPDVADVLEVALLGEE